MQKRMRREVPHMKRIVTALLLGATLLQPGSGALAAESHTLEQLVVEMAKTPADHAALAEHFKSKAADARAEAASHESMAKAYSAGKMVERAKMQEHCNKLAQEYEALAASYDEMAKLEEAEAKAGK
jgi:hypothetical protein